MEKKRYYLAYGSNLNVAQMRQRCPGAVVVGKAEIPDYQLLFKGSKTGAYLTIEKKKGSSVPVGVWSVTEENEAALDAYEGFPNFYYKTEMEVEIWFKWSKKNSKPKKHTAFVYIMHEDRKLGWPSARYVQTCTEGYRTFGFDTQILMDAITESGPRSENA